MMKMLVLIATVVVGVAMGAPAGVLQPAAVPTACGVAEAADDVVSAALAVEARFVEKVCSGVAASADPGSVWFCPGGRAQEIVLPTIVHIIISEDGRNNVTDERVLENIAIANDDYAGRPDNGNYTNTNFRFNLIDIRRVVNDAWANYGMVTGPIHKNALTDDPTNNLNVYITNLNAGVLGYAPFCFYGPEDSFIHGATVHPNAWVGGSQDNYNEGQTLTHELGHHLGLFHAWQGGCNRNIVHPDDVCPQETNSRGCPDPAPASCGDPTCPDNVHNHMDYSDDSCRWEFTPGQSDLMDYRIATWHPGYLSQELRDVIVAAAGAGVWDEARAFQRDMAAQGYGITRQ